MMPLLLAIMTTFTRAIFDRSPSVKFFEVVVPSCAAISEGITSFVPGFRGACHRAALHADPLARDDGLLL